MAASSSGGHTREIIEHGTQAQCCPWAVAASSEGKKGVNDIVVDDQDDVRTAWTAIIDRLFLARFVLLPLPVVVPRRELAGLPISRLLLTHFPLWQAQKLAFAYQRLAGHPPAALSLYLRGPHATSRCRFLPPSGPPRLLHSRFSMRCIARTT